MQAHWLEPRFNGLLVYKRAYVCEKFGPDLVFVFGWCGHGHYETLSIYYLLVTFSEKKQTSILDAPNHERAPKPGMALNAYSQNRLRAYPQMWIKRNPLWINRLRDSERVMRISCPHWAQENSGVRVTNQKHEAEGAFA
jgi:hypothetical protein